MRKRRLERDIGPSAGVARRPVAVPPDPGFERDMAAEPGGPKMVARTSPDEVARRLEKEPDGFLLLDVREDAERATAAILPSIHIPMNEIPYRLAEIPRDKEVIVYCHHGARSELVAGYLEGEGYAHVANLSGGIDAWSAYVDPKVPRYT